MTAENKKKPAVIDRRYSKLCHVLSAVIDRRYSKLCHYQIFARQQYEGAASLLPRGTGSRSATLIGCPAPFFPRRLIVVESGIDRAAAAHKRQPFINTKSALNARREHPTYRSFRNP